MTHFDITQWTDFVRGVADPAQQEAMKAHLAEGCEECAQVATLLGRVCQVADWGARVSVPHDLVTAAIGVFHTARQPSESVWTLLPRIANKCVYSSLSAVALEGARSSADGLVQAVYHSGDYVVDLQIEAESDSDEMALVGQVVNRKAAGQPVAGVPVGLISGGKLITTAQSNRFGEFCLVSKCHRGLRLCVPLETIGKRLEIPLGKLMVGIRS